MRSTAIGAVFLKDMRETLRDRRTLLFMFLLPTVMMPLVMFGLARLAFMVVQGEARREVVIAATPEDQQAWYAMAQYQFAESPAGRAIRMAQSPLLRALLPASTRAALAGDLPATLLTDPEEFTQWARSLAEQQMLMMESATPADLAAMASRPVEEGPLAAQMEDTATAFAAVIQGVGLVHFVDLPATPTLAVALPPTLATHPEGARVAGALASGEFAGVLEIRGETLAAARAGNRDGIRVSFWHNSTHPAADTASQRVDAMVEAVRRAVVRERLTARGHDETFLVPVHRQLRDNLASPSQLAFTVVGGLVPYLVLTFAYLGGFYPAIDLGAGEKERQTLETLLLSPASRLEIAAGKFLVLFLSSLTAAVLGIMAMIASFHYLVPPELLAMLQLEIPISVGFLVAVLAVPSCAIIAALFLGISINSRSFKEAQNTMAPLGMAIILPAAVATLPGVELGPRTAAIPFVSFALLTRDFLKGNADWGYYGIALASSAVLALLCLAFVARQFLTEKVLFRS